MYNFNTPLSPSDPLSWAIITNNVEQVRALIDPPPLTEAEKDEAEYLEMFGVQSEPPVEPTIPLNDEMDGYLTPLARAAGKGHVEIMQVLIDHFTPICGQEGVKAVADEALEQAVKYHQGAAVDLLLAAGADPHTLEAWKNCKPGTNRYESAWLQSHGLSMDIDQGNLKPWRPGAGFRGPEG